MWHIFWRGYSRLRSGREHWAWILAVEVRQGTLGVDGRGWGPGGNTGRGWSWLRSGRAHWRGWSWLRSGREHWAWMVVVEVRQRTLWIAGRSWTRRTRRTRTTRRRRTRRRRRGEEEDQATDINFKNPHLAGGEKTDDITSQMCSSPKSVITPPQPPPPPTPPTNTTPKKTTKKDKKRCFTEAKHNKKGKNALSLWHQAPVQ